MTSGAEPRTAFDVELPSGFVVFCDMDGTLIDTDQANYLSYRKAVLEVTHGVHDVQHSAERLNRESMKKQLPYLIEEEYEKITCLKAKYFPEFLSETRVNNSLAGLMRKFSGNSKTVLVTCCRKKRAMDMLRYHKLRKLFSRLICWEDIPRGGSSNKYENALNLTRTNPAAVIVFENDVADVEEAVLAGVPRGNVISVVSTTGVEIS